MPDESGNLTQEEINRAWEERMKEKRRREDEEAKQEMERQRKQQWPGDARLPG